MESIVVFDIWGDYAHFKKIETTTSPLTYSIPTGTGLSGLIAGMMGYRRDTYYDQFSRENIVFSMKLMNRVKKVRINQNLINTEYPPYLNLYGKDNPRKRIPYEYVRDPKYRIYLGLKDREVFDGLSENLLEHKTVFTPFLGLSEHIANFEFVGEFDPFKKEKSDIEIDSILPKDKVDINLNDVDEGMRWVVENIPMYMNEDRVVQEYAEAIFDSNGNTIPLENAKYYEVGDDNVVFL